MSDLPNAIDVRSMGYHSPSAWAFSELPEAHQLLPGHRKSRVQVVPGMSWALRSWQLVGNTVGWWCLLQLVG